jgi:hypothetical protein
MPSNARATSDNNCRTVGSGGGVAGGSDFTDTTDPRKVSG